MFSSSHLFLNDGMPPDISPYFLKNSESDFKSDINLSNKSKTSDLFHLSLK